MFISPFHMHLSGIAFPPLPNFCLDLSIDPNNLLNKIFLFLGDIILKIGPFLCLFKNIIEKSHNVFFLENSFFFLSVTIFITFERQRQTNWSLPDPI